jgi:tetratricopeptide (TPR) repeat protein
MKILVLVIFTSLVVSTSLAQDPATPSSGEQKSTSPATTQSAELAEAEELNAQLVALYNQRRYDKALNIAKQVLKLREKALGPDHFLVADALANVGELLYVRGLRAEALRTYRRYLITYDKNRDVDTRDTRNVLISALTRHICTLLSILRTEYKDFEEAFELQKRLYKLENGFDFDEAANRPVDVLRRGGLLINRRIKGPSPVTPRARHVYGSLIMKIHVDEQGRVVSAKTICGDDFVVEASEEAILKTTYKPTIVNGKPVPVTALALYFYEAY